MTCSRKCGVQSIRDVMVDLAFVPAPGDLLFGHDHLSLL